MGRHVWVVAIVVGLLVGACESKLCVPGETQRCVCADERTGTQVCGEDGQRWSVCDCPEGDDDDDTLSDDDSTSDDDSAGDDDSSSGDDDDSTPDYSGEIDIHHLDTILHGHCAATVESDPDHPENTPEGWFEFEIELVGWARDC